MTGQAFRLLREIEIPERGSVARSYVHDRTGLEVLSLTNGDVNRCFGIAFRTETPDDTGIGHVLEHVVLCGSRRYPSTAPFAELLKGSLQTHLNAATLPDMTVFKAASRNLRDFYNLFDVYLDAVLHPLLRETTFRQEGWHIEPSEEDGRPAGFGGVVYNEMKGAYGHPAARLDRALRAALFPDTFYRFDHDGDPVAIPSLTPEAMRAFHALHYQPSNALVFLSGDLDVEEALAFLDERLAGFKRGPKLEPPPLQPQFNGPRQLYRTFPAVADVSAGHITRGWVLPPPIDLPEALEQDFLAELLVGSDAGLLRRTVNQSGLGGHVTGSGLSRQTPQPVLSIKMGDLNAKLAVGRFDEIVDGTFTEIVRHGLDPDLANAALHRLEFRLRENDGGRMPPGLALMHELLAFWRAGRDPLDFLAFEKPLATLGELVKDTASIRDRIRRLLADNPHHATVILEPDAEQAAREAAAEQSRLAALLPFYKPPAKEKSAASTVPVLGIDEIGRKEERIPYEIVRESNPRILLFPLQTNGICHFQFGLPLHRLPPSLLPLAPLCGRMMLENGALAARRNRLLGRTSVETRALATSDGPQAWLFLRLAGMQENLPEILALVVDLLAAPLPNDRERFMPLLADEIARHSAGLIQRGHDYADLAVSSALNEAGALAEILQGISQLQFLRRLKNRAEAEWGGIRDDLQDLHGRLVRRNSVICGVTAAPGVAEASAAVAVEALGSLPEETGFGVAMVPKLRAPIGIAVNASVNFVAQGVRLPEDDRAGAFAAVVRHVTGSWLWNRVRMEGGAYGTLARFDPLAGTLRFLSYRDPHLSRTLDVFGSVPEFLRGPISETEIRQGIISAIAEWDRPKLPRESSLEAMLSMLSGDSLEKRQARRDSLLSATRTDFLRLANLIEAQPKRVAVLGSEEALQAALAERPDLFTLTAV